MKNERKRNRNGGPCAHKICENDNGCESTMSQAQRGTTMFDKMGRVPSPFKTCFIDVTDSASAEAIFRREHGDEWQIDEIQVNMFCALVIYHHITDPTR